MEQIHILKENPKMDPSSMPRKVRVCQSEMAQGPPQEIGPWGPLKDGEAASPRTGDTLVFRPI